jgi:hypothetical protein
MPEPLKADIASQELVFGPFLDKDNGVTAETVISAPTAARIWKNGVTSTINLSTGRTPAWTHDGDGFYTVGSLASDVDTEGRLKIEISGAATHLPVWENFVVLNANVYDSLYAAAGTDKLQVDIEEIDGDATAAENLNAACDNYSVTRGLAGTALPAAVADAAGGLPISDAGGLDLDLYIKSQVTLSGTAAAGDTTVKITLTGGVATDNYYNGQRVIITGGTGVGQSRTIGKYLAASTAATPTRDFTVAPDNTSTFVVIGADVPGLLEAGVAQAGAAATITLDATASGTTDIYKNNFVAITGGTGVGQTRLIGGYVGGTKVATILPNWTTIPDSTSVYMILPMARVDIQGWLGNVVTGDGDWAALKAETAVIQTDTTTDIPALIATAQADLDIITGASGVVIADGALTAAKFAADCITAAKIADDALVAANFATGCLTADAFAADALVAATFATDSITSDALAASAVNEIWDATEALTGDAHSFETILARLYMFLQHAMNITDNTGAVALRNTGDTADIMTQTISDNDTLTTRTEASWV